MLADIWRFTVAVVRHWQGCATGGVVMALLDRLLARADVRHGEVVFVEHGVGLARSGPAARQRNRPAEFLRGQWRRRVAS